MKYSRVLILTLFATITIFLAVPVTSGTDCTPQGQWVSDVTSGACGYMNSSALSKTGNWNITWPDGHANSLTPTGSGECTYNWNCNLLAAYGNSYCWPSFYQPVATSAGGFSILVENKVAAPEIHDCPNSITTERRVYCNTSGQFMFVKSHTCTEECSQEQAEQCIASLGQWREQTCYCDHSIGPHTPILIDVDGDGFSLTNPTNGVNFDLDNDGDADRVAWTAIGSDEMFLVLDRNSNGAIDNGIELFGDLSPQPDPPDNQQRNGFLALAEYDKPTNGGNSDGLITPADAIFQSLRVWQDLNHNGISEGAELFSLSAFNLKRIELNYKVSKKTDEFGNQFRYRAKVTDSKGVQLGRWAWDVFLVTAP